MDNGFKAWSTQTKQIFIKKNSRVQVGLKIILIIFVIFTIITLYRTYRG